MIKEKHEKSVDSVKEESGSSDKDGASTETGVQKDDESGGAICQVKKEPGRPITKNGGVIGSTNTGSIHSATDHKPENDSSIDIEPSTLKTEECIEGDLPSDAFNLNLPGATTHPPPPDGVQPLPSNVINKQSNNMEVQYMQQQSQIFVFSTLLANSGADEVLQGHYPTIIAYHCAQPGTKKYLEKNPLKMNQFNRQNPAQWLNNLVMMKNKSSNRSPSVGPKSQAPIDNFLGSESLEDMVGLTDNDLPWDQKNNHLDDLEAVSNGLPEAGPDMDSCSSSLASMQPSLQGVKVPDENLTPQQRQHREVQLATIRKMQQMLFPENQAAEGECGELAHEMMAGGPNPGVHGPGSMSAQVEWQKLQQQFYENRSGSNLQVANISPGPRNPTNAVPPVANMSKGVPVLGPRSQGPPPPYHQTPRSASVPVALQSPSPASPNNPTSNLSLPSPRASSALNSPADPNRPFTLTRHMSTGQSPTSQESPTASRHNQSNPGTPVSTHLSPSVTNTSSEPISSHQPVDAMYGRSVPMMGQPKQQMNMPVAAGHPASKEPNLMPVPSPQQIQYLNAFEGQELIIQKQPNTSLKERNVMSPSVLPSTMDSGFPGNSDIPSTTASSATDSNRFTSTSVPSNDGRFQIPSPHTPNAPPGEKGPSRVSGPGSSPQSSSVSNPDPLKSSDLFPSPTSHLMDVHNRFSGPNTSPSPKISGNFVVSPSSKSNIEMAGYGCGRADNQPLNPNCNSTMPGSTKAPHFDPISSLAQMSQQLTNSVATSLNGQGGQGGAMMNFGSPSMHMMDMGGCHMGDMDQGSPGVMGMAMQGPPHGQPHGQPHGFHPNSQMGPIRSLSPKLPGAFTNHMPIPRMMGRPPGPNPYNGANVQVKPNAPNTIQYIPAKSQVGVAPPGPRGPPSLDFLQRFANPLSNLESKMPTQNLQYFPNCVPQNSPIQGPPGGLPPHIGHMDGHIPPDAAMGPMMIGNGSNPMMANMGGMMPMMRGPMRPPAMMRMPQMGFNGPSGGGPDALFNPNAQMFVGGGAKGPTTADPTYAQQFHNFQQQLYATSTRSQMGGQTIGPGPGPPPPQSPYFNAK